VDVVVADPVFAGRAVNFHPAIVIRNTAVGPAPQEYDRGQVPEAMYAARM
jgi:hypothetical protein